MESADFPETEPTAPAPLRQLITRPVLIAVLNHAFLNFCSMSYDALLPLVYTTPIGLGGLGLTPYSIGLDKGKGNARELERCIIPSGCVPRSWPFSTLLLQSSLIHVRWP